MKLVNKIEKWLLYIGVVTSCFGLMYVLDMSNRMEYMYASGIGLILTAVSVFLSSFSKKNM
ncbi:hypothetical protein [Ferdinandcohnia sp. Marseille-Q9671]